MPFVYILRCSDGTFYTGYAVNLQDRVLLHNKGKASKYTRVRLPVSLLYFEEFKNSIDAYRREFKIKKMRRDQKIKMMESNNISFNNSNSIDK
jgi:putative endonuclease